MKVTLLVGIITAVVAAFCPLRMVAELVNIGALFAFMVVALGVLILRYRAPLLKRPFRCPLVPVIPVLCILFTGYLIANLQTSTHIQFVVWMLLGLVVYFTTCFRRHGRSEPCPVPAAREVVVPVTT